MMRILARHAFVLPMVLATTAVFAKPSVEPALPSDAEVAAFAQRALDEAVPDPAGPGMAVLVARGDTVLFRGARGMASIELGVALKPDHVFRIGSVTKQFAAALLLALVEDGKAKLDEPLSRFLPDYPNGGAITLRQLLDHTSGVRSYTDLPGYMDEGVRLDRDTKALIAVFKDEKPDFAPGAEWRYNNSGYVLVGAVIEAIGGKPWHEQLQERFLRPLQLAHTRYGDDAAIVPGFVNGYTRGLDGKPARAGYLSMTQPHAAGALVSTVDDLLHWNLALHGGKVLPPEAYRRMTTPQGVAKASHYGFGIERHSLRGQTSLQHGGGIHGFLSSLVYLPDSRLSGVMLRNTDGASPSPLLRRVLAFAVGNPYPDPVEGQPDAGKLDTAQGVYRLDAKTTRTLKLEDGKLVSQRSGGSPFTMVWLGGDRFGFPDSTARLELVRDRKGVVTALRFFPEGDEAETWAREGDLPPPSARVELSAAAKAELAGEYTSSELSLAVLVGEDGRLRVQVPGQPAFELQAQAPRVLRVEAVDATLTFEPDAGPAQRLSLVQGSARFELVRKP